METHPTHLRHVSLAALLALCLAWFACSPPTAQKTCQQDGECPSGQVCQQNKCRASSETCLSAASCASGQFCIQGKCVFPNTEQDCGGGECGRTADAGTTEALPEKGVDRNSAEPATPDTAPQDSPVADKRPVPDQPAVCRPNRNGQIERNEFLFKIGSSVIYQEAGSSSQPVTVDIKGSTDKDGKRTWDFRQKPPGAVRVIDELLPLQGRWYADKFKGATYATYLDRSLGLFGIYKATPTALQLMGSASKEANKTRTNYDTPLDIIQFPLTLGKKWTAKATSTGTLQYVPYRAQETYEFHVDAEGTVKTAIGDYPVLRLKLKFTQQQYLPALYRRTRTSYFFASECFGFLVLADSKDYERNAPFTQAVKLKQLSN